MLVSHPTGNTFVRALLSGLLEQGRLEAFYTTVAVWPDAPYLALLPGALRKELLRRTYDLPEPLVHQRPWRELARLTSSRWTLPVLTAHETGWASVDAVYRDLDRYLAARLCRHRSTAVYCYEDGALQTFRAAKHLGEIRCFYDLPIAHWQTSRRLLEEEAERLPAWEPTLVGTRDSAEKLDRKTEELALADVVVCPSRFVYDTLPPAVRDTKTCIVAEFGSPVVPEFEPAPRRGPLRLLFAGSMSQRKGLADLFAAVKLLSRSDIELVVMGSPVQPMAFYRSQYSGFTYEPPRPHREVLRLMQSCDVLVLPSIVEGRALVQQEAMMCGLPLIVTPNTGGEDLLEEGKTGFLVPIRSPERIAEKLSWFADNREQLPQMGVQARQKAARVTWKTYQSKILASISPVTSSYK